ncbi:MAG: lipopolysaccharide biosynthesis protein [Desulfobacteraceae bacterium]|nr:lipopolysaccharide biosynthesis protein [Desulfobacteraceae bacterium]
MPKFVSPIVQLVLAKLLIPADFGLVAIATLVIAFVEAIRETGFSRAFIQRNDSESEMSLFNTVFWMSIGTGVCFYLMIFLTAPLIAKFFHNPHSILVIRIMAIQMILSSLNTCHNSSMIKKLEYNKLFKVNLLPAITPLFVTVPLAYIGFNVWALVIGYLTSSVIRTFALWYFVPIKPLFEFDTIIAKKVLYFGSLCSLEAMLGWFYMWGDKAIVGHFLNASQLGLYSIASMIVVFIFSSVFSPLSISYPLLCGLKNDIGAIRSVLYKLLHIVASISPLLGILILFNVNVIPFLIGEKWTGIELPLGILAITQSFSYIVTITIPDALKAINRPDVMPKLQSVKLLYTLPAFIAGAKYGGLAGFCYAKLATVIVGFVIFVIIGTKFLDLNWKNIFIILYPKMIAVIMTIITLACLKSLLPLNNYIYAETAINCITAIVMYFIVLAIIDRKGMYDLIQMAKRVMPENSIFEVNLTKIVRLYQKAFRHYL